MTSLTDIACSTVDRHGMLPQGCRVVALVSGGADSTAMLWLLASGTLGDADVSVLHVNHLLRGRDSDADEDFVTALCERVGVPCRIVRYEVAAYAEDEGLNLEDAGRRVRYRFAEEELESRIDEFTRRRGAGRIAVAHTFDDRMETFLARLASGSGPTALASIRPVRDSIVRPLIDARRTDVVAYLEGLGQPWREDASNADASRQRAFIRAELLPIMERLNPRLDEALARTLGLLGDEDEMLADMAAGFADAFAESRMGEVAFDLRHMRTLSRPMARRVVREALSRTFPDAARLEADHVEALVDGISEERFARDLPFGLRAYGEYGRMFISRERGSAAPVPPSLLLIPGTADLGEAGVLTAEYAGPDAPFDPASSAVVDAGSIRGPLVVDGPRAGDRMRPLGMDGTKKLSDLLSEARIPRRKRPGVPVVRNGQDVVWVAGVRVSEDYRIGPGTSEAIRITWRR